MPARIVRFTASLKGMPSSLRAPLQQPREIIIERQGRPHLGIINASIPDVQTSPPLLLSRRAALAGLAITAASGSAIAEQVSDGKPGENGAGPTFSPLGPNAELYGAAEGYPVADLSLAHQPGEPHQIKYRVGAYSHFDEIFPTHRIRRSAAPWMFKRSPVDIRYDFRGNRSSLAKSITAMLIGIAIGDGAIKSVDDTAETYVPGFKGTEYGKTPIRDLLHMSSGVEFGETKDGQRDLDRLWIDMVWGLGPTKGTINSIVQFNRRIAPPGTKYFYASIEADVLGVVLHYAVNQSASDYLREKLWQPIGAEADATWLVDAQGFEVAHGFFNTVLRDYARLARLLAHDGVWEGKQIIQAQYMIEATTTRPSDTYLAPGKATPRLGYGYLLWLLPGARREFALLRSEERRVG